MNLTDRLTLLNGDCLAVMRDMPDASVDAVVCDPPYGLSAEPDMAEVMRHWMAGDDYVHTGSGFMGKSWDSFVPGPSVWREALRVLKPGGHLAAFFGTRTYDIGTLAIRLAGFEVRDQLAWVYGSGFPKSLDVSKAIDKAAGVEFGSKPASGVGFMGAEGPGGYNPTINQLYRVGDTTPEAAQWAGWGTALKPAWEPICLARKPLIGTVASNVLAHGTGGINVDGCRVKVEGEVIHVPQSDPKKRGGVVGTDLGITGASIDKFQAAQRASIVRANTMGRFPANLIHDGSDEVLAGFPVTGPSKAAARGGSNPNPMDWGNERSDGAIVKGHDDAGGSAARFFYCAKASRSDRQAGNEHPTVKPTPLMEWLARLITPPGGLVLDPFMGSGSTGKACHNEGFRFVGIERDPDYYAMAVARIWDHVS